jgi:hypothetical protein
MPRSSTAEKILTSLKGLRDHMQAGEEPLFRIPAIWHDAQEQRGMACDVVLTNQRLLGYVFVTFPRQRLFLEDLSLSSITIVSLRHKSFEPILRELLVSDGQRKVYIHAPRKKIEDLYQALRNALEKYAPATQTSLEGGKEDDARGEHARPVYGRQEIRRPFERSPLAITLLFTGGLLLEIMGGVLWALTQNIQAGLPLFIAGFFAVLTAFIIRRPRR